MILVPKDGVRGGPMGSLALGGSAPEKIVEFFLEKRLL